MVGRTFRVVVVVVVVVVVSGGCERNRNDDADDGCFANRHRGDFWVHSEMEETRFVLGSRCDSFLRDASFGRRL